MCGQSSVYSMFINVAIQTTIHRRRVLTKQELIGAGMLSGDSDEIVQPARVPVPVPMSRYA